MASINLQFMRATAAVWATNNYVLLDGQPGYETDTGKFKIGRGATAWNALPYAIPTANAVSVALAVQSGAANVLALNFAQPMYPGALPPASTLSATITRATGGTSTWPVNSLAYTNSTTAAAGVATPMAPGDTALVTYAEGTSPGFLTLASRTPLPSFSTMSVANNTASLMETTWSGSAVRLANNATYTPDVSNAEAATWTVINGVNIDGAGNAVLHGATNDALTYVVASRKNFVFSSQISISGDSATRCLFFVRAKDGANAWLLILSQTTLTLQRELAGAYTANNFTTPAAASVATTTIADGAVHTVTIDMSAGNTAVFSIDGNVLATATVDDVVANKWGIGYFANGGGASGVVTVANTKLYY